MKAYHNDPAVKTAILAQLRAHRLADAREAAYITMADKLIDLLEAA